MTLVCRILIYIYFIIQNMVTIGGRMDLRINWTYLGTNGPDPPGKWRYTGYIPGIPVFDPVQLFFDSVVALGRGIGVLNVAARDVTL